MKTIDKASTIILGFGHTANIDIDAQEELEHMIVERRASGTSVYITGLHEQSLHMMEHGAVYKELLDG
jgi:MFS superfamily sulfate permease-like transporter